MAVAKRSTRRKRRARTSSSSLGKLSVGKMFKDLSTPTSVAVGIFLGHRIGLLIDKQTGTVNGMFGEDGKKFIKPAAEILLGMSVAQLSKNPLFKNVGYGIAVHGGYVLVKDGFGKDVLSGLNGDEFESGLLPAASTDLDLPELSSKLDEIEGIYGDDEDLDELEDELEQELNEVDGVQGTDDDELDDVEDEFDEIEIE